MITQIKLYQVYKFLCTVEEDKAPWCTLKAYWEKQYFSWIIPGSGKGKLIHEIAFDHKLGCTWWVMEDREVWCVPQGNLILGENQKLIKLYYVNNYPTVCITT